jgi:hypothetical protein
LRADARFRCKRQPRRWNPSDYHGPSPPVTGTAPLPRTPSAESSRRGSHGSPGSLCGAKVGLTVSGLKPDSPPRSRIAGSAPGRRPCARTCRWQEQRPTAAAGGTTRPSADLQNDFSSDERETASKPGVFREAADARRTASPESVRPDADEQADCRDQKGLQMQAFSRAADGIRTHDLLHGKQNMRPRAAQESPGKERFPSSRASAMLPSFCGEITGVSGLKPD